MRSYSDKEFEDDLQFKCWKCTKLIPDLYNHQFFCRHGKILFEASEIARGNFDCKEYMDEKRKNITGKTTYLYRLLVIYHKLALHSLPFGLIGAIGNLNKYGLCNITESMTKSRIASSGLFGQPYKDKIIELSNSIPEKGDK